MSQQINRRFRMTAYHIDIKNGVISYDSHKVSKAAGDAPNAKAYFAARNKAKPARIKVMSWPFASMYLTNGTEENGQSIAFA